MRSSFRTGLVLGGGSLVCSLPGGGGEGSGLLGFMGERGERGVCRVVVGEEVSEDCSLFVRCGRYPTSLVPEVIELEEKGRISKGPQ